MRLHRAYRETKPAFWRRLVWRTHQVLLSFILIIEIQTYRQDLLSCYTYSVAVRETWDLFFPPLPIPVLCWARHREIRSAGLASPEHRHFMRKSANEGGSETGSYCHFISVPLPTTTTVNSPVSGSQVQHSFSNQISCLPGKEATSGGFVFSTSRSVKAKRVNKTLSLPSSLRSTT